MYSLSKEQLRGLVDFLKSNGDRLGGEFVQQVIKDGALVDGYFTMEHILPVPDPESSDPLHNLSERVLSVTAYGLLIALGRK